MAKRLNVRLGDLLIEKGIITQAQLDQVLKEKEESGGFFAQALIRLGIVTEEKVLPILAEQLGIEYVRVNSLQVDRTAIEKVPARFAVYYKLMPVRFEDNLLTVAIADPLDVHTLDDLRLLINCKIRPVLASEKEILEGINKYYGVGAETIERIIDDVPLEKKPARAGFETQDLADLSEDASIIKFVNQLLLGAYNDRATDIHIEPFQDSLRARYRIDGILYETPIPPTIKQFQDAIVSRIKIMASLNIAERRLPQDGRIKVKVEGKELDLRVSVLPTPYGESVDIRLLSTDILLDLKSIGFTEEDLAVIGTVIKKPHGIVFLTGPTGSGKTTTLYAMLNSINATSKKILTIEDPIEYMLYGIIQMQVQPKIDFTFATGLRSMLRHDPDVMMVGEVRDFETAEIAIRSALTGHLVFSTLHTNDAAGAITRLLDMGVEPYLVSSSLESIIAQRLVRRICSQCKKEVILTPSVLKEMGVKEMMGIVKAAEGAGCEACKFTGYKGRTAIHEILILNEDLRDLVMERSGSNTIRLRAIEQGMRTLRESGWEKVKLGITTPSEVIRVTQQGALLDS
ncbi:MAG: Flp pilus assembly complex ATPase component TadA [Candidatus Omnitrophica bacterium]|nr:Flp pilus assembly complex ATPase component TadA [Candidatus Omnitrophota bacterium]